MKTRDALVGYLVERGLVRQGAHWEDCYARFWVALPVLGRNVLFFPTLGKWGVIPLHDVNHLLSGCDTSWRGELEVAGWELASGGCGWHLLYWIDRVSFFAFGLVVAPRTALKGFRRGRAQRNVYRLSKRRVLEMEFDDLRRYARGDQLPS